MSSSSTFGNCASTPSPTFANRSTTLCSSRPTASTTRAAGVKLKEIDGTNVKPTPAGQEAFVHKQQILEDFASDCVQASEMTPNVKWCVECSDSPHGLAGPWGSSEESPANWDRYADWGTFWDTPIMKEMFEKRGAKRTLQAACDFEDAPQYQKFFETAWCKDMVAHAETRFKSGS